MIDVKSVFLGMWILTLIALNFFVVSSHDAGETASKVFILSMTLLTVWLIAYNL